MDQHETTRRTLRVGIDTGGTFTDLVVLDDRTGEVRVTKLASTPDDPSRAFADILRRAIEAESVDPAMVGDLVHGTTVATNTIIEGKGARTALVTTEGFRDVLEIARQTRPELYNLNCEKPPPVVPRRFAFEATERLAWDGSVVTPLDESSVQRVVDAIGEHDIEAVAVCLLHAYVNDEHERRVAELLRARCPDVRVTVSRDVCPEMREYFRASTTAINALLSPVVGRYVAKLARKSRDLGVDAEVQLMTSAGGRISAAEAERLPVQLIESGPAAGVTATARLGEALGIDRLISFDMGGTTAKLGLVEDGRARIVPHFEVGAAAMTDDRGAGYPVRTPVIDLVEIGAGGGSLAWIDAGGGLRVGPRSAGADPGPACYGLGQTEPTVTDANLVLGRLGADAFLGGAQRLDAERAREAIDRVTKPLNLDLIAAALGVVEIATASMVSAAHLISVRRGFDPRDFTLVAFGGAGPLHAVGIAQQLGCRRVLVPPTPGVASAIGLVVGDARHDYVQAMVTPTDQLDIAVAQTAFGRFEQQGEQTLRREGVQADAISFLHQLDMRYIGQAYELAVDVRGGRLDGDALAQVERDFYAQHERVYGYATPDAPTEVVNVRTTAIGRTGVMPMREVDAGGGVEGAIKSSRAVGLSRERIEEVAIYDRALLGRGDEIEGPAVIEQYDSTTYLPPGWRCVVDAHGHLLLEGGVT